MVVLLYMDEMIEHPATEEMCVLPEKTRLVFDNCLADYVVKFYGLLY